MFIRLRVLCLILLTMAARSGWAGESGLNVIVVVNQNSSNSLQLGNDYCERRHVPSQNLFRMTGWTGGTINWAQTDFENFLINPLLAQIASRGLTNQAQIILLSMDIPYRVYNGDSQNGTTSALYYGFKTNTTPAAGLPDTCSLPGDSTNSYAYSELPFDLAEPAVAATNSFLAVMLTDTNVAQAEITLERGAASDNSFPAEPVYLEKTSDSARNARFFLFDNAIQECRARGDNDLLRETSDSTTITNALGLDTGLFAFSLPTNAFVPGTLADDLDSYGGSIFDDTGETPLLAFIEAGASGSYGTVVEPCNFTYKFPDPMVYFYQDRGFCMAEAYYQSLANPYQGLIVGDPLSAPFALAGSAVWTSPGKDGDLVSGSPVFNVTFAAADTNHPLAQVDLFIDGSFVETLTNLPPGAGNVFTVTVNGAAVSYTNANGDSLGTAASGLASALMAQQSATGVEAEAVGDRVVLRSENVAEPGSRIPMQTVTATGTAPVLTSFATAAQPTFLDSTADGYHVVQAANDPNIGDWLQLTIIKTNGAQVTVAVTNNVSGANISSLLQALMDQINATPALQTADGANATDLFQEDDATYAFLINAASVGWPAAQIQTIFTGSTNLDASPGGTNALQDNLRDLQPRDHVYLSSGAASLPVQFTLDTTMFADGFHELTAVAYEGTSVRTQTWARRTVQFHNTELSATFSVAEADTHGDILFEIAANSTNITRIELFSTGGSMGVATNQSAAELTAPASTLGDGDHPFYAMVTDSNGREYRTPTLWEQIPALRVIVGGQPATLSWPAIAGRTYTVLEATNLGGAMSVVGSVTATNSQAKWDVPIPTAGATFYSVTVTE